MKVWTFYRVILTQAPTSMALSPHVGTYEFHYIVRGSGIFQNGLKTCPFSNNTIFFTPPGTQHSITFDQGCKNIFYYCSLFEPHTADKKLISMIKQRFEKGLYVDPKNVICLDAIRQKVFSGNDLLHQSGVDEFSSFLHDILGRTSDNRDQENVYVEAATHIMQEEANMGLNMDTLSQKLGLNKSYFIRLFRKKMGIPPLQYFIRMKIETACYLLKDSQLSISTIAEQLHFFDEFHFSRVFKKRMGIPPSDYRRGTLSSKL